MRVPQEIADAIIDNLAPFNAAEPLSRLHSDPLQIASPMRACALTCRTFLARSQSHSFASILCDSADTSALEALTLESPHLTSYIKYFSIILNSRQPDGVGVQDVEFEGVSRILRVLPNLHHISIFANPTLQWVAQPRSFRAAVNEVLGLPHLHSLSLRGNYTFANVHELESLLSCAPGLKALELELTFDDASTAVVDTADGNPSVILDSLRITSWAEVADAAVNSMLATFARVDIKSLRVLEIRSPSPLISLLKANKRTLQRVYYRFPDAAHSDADILKNNTALRHIDITAYNPDMTASVQLFGDLRNLQVLETLTLRFAVRIGGPNAQMTDQGWAALNGVLKGACDTLQEMRIYALNYGAGRAAPDVAVMRAWLPAVAEKISVHLLDY